MLDSTKNTPSSFFSFVNSSEADIKPVMKKEDTLDKDQSFIKEEADDDFGDANDDNVPFLIKAENVEVSIKEEIEDIG